jgi:hypothetical protein
LTSNRMYSASSAYKFLYLSHIPSTAIDDLWKTKVIPNFTIHSSPRSFLDPPCKLWQSKGGLTTLHVNSTIMNICLLRAPIGSLVWSDLLAWTNFLTSLAPHSSMSIMLRTDCGSCLAT